MGCELDDYAVPAIGDRTKVVNDNKITSIYFREVPELIFISYKDYNNNENIKNYDGYIPVFIQNNLESLFSISAQGKSAKDTLDELLYNHSYCVEDVTLQAIPVYNLQPNYRIYIND